MTSQTLNAFGQLRQPEKLLLMKCKLQVHHFELHYFNEPINSCNNAQSFVLGSLIILLLREICLNFKQYF